MGRRITEDIITERLTHCFKNQIAYEAGFSNMNSTAVFKCKICNFYIVLEPKNLLAIERLRNGKVSASPCYKCRYQFTKQNISFNKETFEKNIESLGLNFSVVDTYTESNHQCRMKCLTCGNMFWFLPNNILGGVYPVCPKC